MSNAVFPTFVGLSWPVNRRPIWKTSVYESASGRESRVGHRTYPKYEIELQFDYLSLDDWKTLLGFFNQRGGKFDSFLFTDQKDKTATDAQFGIGNGTQTQFQIVRSLGGFAEPCENLNGSPVIKKDGVLQLSGYTVSSTGVVSFSSAPTAGEILTWSGNYYWRVRFDQDVSEFKENMEKFFELKKLQFVGAVGNKV